MNVLTLTCHRPYNYGAVLQSYALQHYLDTQGIDTAIIDYYPDYQRKRKKKSLIIQLIWSLYSLPDLVVGKHVFETFLKENIRLTKQYKSLDELMSCPPKADGIIIISIRTMHIISVLRQKTALRPLMQQALLKITSRMV